jgi:radical SAM superfamily enzyme YgiQ (UPF0313 family)
MTPPDHEVRIVTEDVEPVDFEADCDLVGITCTTANAVRAYEIADEFKRRGKQVVLGGVHPTMLPAEALEHADSVVIGEAENVWEELLEDAENRRLRRKYNKPYPSLDRYVSIKHRKTKGSLFNVIPVMTTRGCPFNCEFCSVHSVFGRRIRHYPINYVIRSIVDSGGKYFFILDDNVVGDNRYSKELFRRMKPLAVKWVGQASISIADDSELLQLASDSGCLGLFFGLESVSEAQIERFPKLIRDRKKLEDSIRKVRESGIIFHPSLIFGFDEDTRSTFGDTLEFLDRNRIGTADFCMLTPYPGTRLYQRLKQEDRLLTEDWKWYDRVSVVHRPLNLTPQELQIGALWTKYQFTKTSAIIKRLPFHLSILMLYLAISFSYRRNCRNQVESGKYGVSVNQVNRENPFTDTALSRPFS